MTSRLFSLLLSLFISVSFTAQGSTQTMPRATHLAAGSSSSSQAPKSQKIDIMRSLGGGFSIDFCNLFIEAPLVELHSRGEHIATLSFINGSVQFETHTGQDFSFRGIPFLKGLRVISEGNVTFKEEVDCKEGGIFDVAGRCQFQQGIRFEDPEATIFLGRGSFDFDGASTIPQMHLLNHPTISIKKGAFLENDMLISQEKGPEKPTLKNSGRFISKMVYGHFDKIQTGAGSLTDIKQAHVVCARAINRGDFSIAKGYLETASLTNLKTMDLGELDLCALETINRGLFKAKILKATQGNFHNTDTGTLEVTERFTGNFNVFKDDGESIFGGFANILAKEARLSNHTQGYAVFLHASDSLFVSKDATFDIQHHLTCFSERDLDLAGDAQVNFNPNHDQSFEGFQEETRRQITGLQAGAFFSAQQDLRHRGQARSTNSTLSFQAGETFSDEGSNTQSGYFRDNTIQITAKHAELTGEARSFDGMVVQADSAVLHGKRKTNKHLHFQIKKSLSQLEGDMTKGKLVTGHAGSMDLAGYVESGKQTHLEADGDLRVQGSARMTGGPAALKGKDVVVGGQFADIRSVMVGGKNSLSVEKTGRNKGDGDFVLKGKKIHIDAPVSTKTGDFIVDAKKGAVTFGAHADIRPENSRVTADTITHQRGSVLNARGMNSETAQKKLTTEEGSLVQADTNVLRSVEGDIEIGGRVKSAKNTYTNSKGKTTVTGTGDVESGETTIAKAEGDFLNFGSMHGKDHSIRTDGLFLNTHGGSIKSKESFTVDAAVYANVLGGNITAKSARVNADLLSVSCGFSNLSARDVEINAPLNVVAGARINGGRSYTVNAGANIALGAFIQSMNYTSNAPVNVSDITLLSGLPSSYSLPSFDDRKDWWDSEKSFFEQGIVTYVAKTSLSMVGGVAGGSIGKGVAGLQTAMGAGSLLASLPDLLSFDDVPEEDKWRPSHLTKKFGQGLAAYRSAQNIYRGATELLTPTQGPQPQPKPFWTRMKETAASTFGPQTTVNSIWNNEGSATGGWNWNVTGQFTRNTSHNSSYGTTCAFTNTTNAAWGEDHSTVHALRDTTRVSGDYTLGGEKHVLWDLSARTGGNLTLDSDLSAHAGQDIDFTAGGSLSSEVGFLASSGGQTTLTAKNELSHGGKAFSEEGATLTSKEGNVTLQNGSSTRAGAGKVVYVGAEQGNVTVEKGAGVFWHRQDLDLAKAPSYVFKGQNITSHGRFFGAKSLFFEAANDLRFGEDAYHDVQETFGLKAGGCLHYPGSILSRGQNLAMEAPNLCDIPNLAAQDGHYHNFFFDRHVEVTLPGHVAFPMSLTSASSSFVLNADSITVNAGVDVYVPEALSLHANAGDFTLGHGASVRSGLFTDIYASGDVIGRHNLTTWDWTSKHTRGNVQGADFSAAAFQGGTGVNYTYNDPVTGEESVIQLGLRVRADGEIRGTGMTFDAPGSVMVDSVKGIANEGLSVDYLKDYTSSHGVTRTKRSYDYDTFFFTGGVKSSNGRVLLYSTEGGFMQRAGYLSAAQGMTAHVHGDIYTPELFGTKGYQSRRSGNAAQNLLRPFWDSDKTNKDELGQSIDEIVLSGPLHHISDTGDIVMPGRLLRAPNSTEYLKGKRLTFEAAPLHHSRKAQGFEWGVNFNLGTRPLGFFKGMGKGLSLIARPWKLHDIYRRDGFKEALKAGPLAALGGDATLYSDMKHIVKTFAEKGLKEGLKDLSPSVGVTLDYVTQRRGWDTTGGGYTLVGNAVHIGDELYLGGGYNYSILGDFHADIAQIFLTGQRLGFYNRDFRAGEGLTLGMTGPKIDLHISYDGTKGHSYTPSIFSVGGTFTGHIGHLHQDAGIMKIYDAHGRIGQVISRSRQVVSSRKFSNASVAYNPITQELSASLGGTPDRIRTRLNPIDPSGVFIENAGRDCSIGENGGIDLTGAKLKIRNNTGATTGPVTKHDLPDELNGEGMSFTVSASSSKSTKEAPPNDVLSGTFGGTYHHGGNSYGVTVPVTFVAPETTPVAGTEAKETTTKTSFLAGLWNATKDVSVAVTHGGQSYRATPNSVVEFCDRGSWRAFRQDVRTISHNTYEHFFPTPQAYIPTPEPTEKDWMQPMLAMMEDCTSGTMLAGVSLISEYPADMDFELSGMGDDDIPLIGLTLPTMSMSNGINNMSLGNEFFERILDDPTYDPFSPLNPRNYSVFESQYGYDFSRDQYISHANNYHDHNPFMHVLHEGLLIEGGIHMPHYFPHGHAPHSAPNTKANYRLWNRSVKLANGIFFGNHQKTIPLYTASKSGTQTEPTIRYCDRVPDLESSVIHGKASSFLEADPRWQGRNYTLGSHGIEVEISLPRNQTLGGVALGEGVLGGHPSYSRTSATLLENRLSEIFPQPTIFELGHTPLGGRLGNSSFVPEAELFTSRTPLIGNPGQPWYGIKGTQVSFGDLRSYEDIRRVFAFAESRPETIYSLNNLKEIPISFSYGGKTPYAGFMNHNPSIHYGPNGHSLIGINNAGAELHLPLSGVSDVSVLGVGCRQTRTSYGSYNQVFLSAKQQPSVNINAAWCTYSEEIIHHALLSMPSLIPEGATRIAVNTLSDYHAFKGRAAQMLGDQFVDFTMGTIPSEFSVEKHYFGRFARNIEKAIGDAGKLGTALEFCEAPHGDIGRHIPKNILNSLAEEQVAGLAQLKEAGINTKALAPRSTRHFTAIEGELNALSGQATSIYPTQPHLAFCDLPAAGGTRNVVPLLDVHGNPLQSVGTISKPSWWRCLSHSPKIQGIFKGTKTVFQLGALPVDWGLHIFSEMQDGYDIHDALGRGNVRFTTDSIVYGGFYGGLSAYTGCWPAVGLGLLSIGVEKYVPEHSDFEIARGHNTMAQAAQDQDPMALWNALHTTRTMHSDNALRDIFTAPSACAAWTFDQVQTHAPEIARSISLNSRYQMHWEDQRSDREHLQALERVNWIRGVFGKEPYDTGHFHVENPRQLMARVEMEQTCEDMYHTIRRGSQEMGQLLKDYQDVCDLKSIPPVHLSREEQEVLEDMCDIYRGL